MIESMTGYANAECIIKNKNFTIEIKSYNSKNLEIFFKLPSNFRYLENQIKPLIQKKLIRGSVEVSLLTNKNVTANLFNISAAKLYYQQVQNLSVELNIAQHNNILELVLRNPEVLNSIDITEFVEYEIEIINQIDQLLDSLILFRQKEGVALLTDLSARIKKIKQMKMEIEMLAPQRIEYQKNILKKKIENLSLSGQINQDRFEQELIYYIEKIDITEELIRFDSHCIFFEDFIYDTNEGNLKGKKLSFIVQEILREINTVGSKAQNSEIQKIVINIKDEIEKIKEQLNNIL